MKVLSTDGLTKLIQLIKSAFISVDDTVTTTTVELADVATSGSYNDLSDKPTIPAAQVNSDWNATSGLAQILNKPNLATVATSGSYNDLSNKPTIPDTSNLANKDLSNLTTTGNAKFQAPLVSGTNIKTINSTSLLGNGNINVADTTLSNVASIDANSAVQTALDGKVSKSGDTMTGALTVETAGSATDVTQDNCRVYLKNLLMDVNATPSENLVSALTFTDKYGNQTGACYTRQRTNGVSDTRLSANKNGKSAILTVGLNANDIAYCTFPNSICVDGQWIAESQTICSNRTAETSDKNWTLNLPNDSYDYEVLLVGTVTTGATSGNQARINLQSSIIQSNIVICNAQTRTTSTVTTYGACIIPVGSNHIVTVKGWGSNTGAYSLYLRGYRRIGTNE